jgi:hypothetical protein
VLGGLSSRCAYGERQREIAFEITLSRSCANRASLIATRSGSAGAPRSIYAPRTRARAIASASR